ncbi:DUF2461 domain-containing protein [[Clostridium] leptum]|nr:DUF2461 domain-containing protein [[Clostridium] leptum]
MKATEGRFEGFSKQTMDFLWDLRFNNRKDWFEGHRQIYQDSLLTPFRLLGQELTEFVTSLDSRHEFKNHVSRIYKDARYSREKVPYNDHLWQSPRPILLDKDQWKERPMYYFELHPEYWGFGMGYFSASKPTMDALRARIDQHPGQFEKARKAFEGQDSMELCGDLYKRPKAEKPPEVAQWYNRKDIYFSARRPIGEILFSRDFLAEIYRGFEAIKPVYDFLWSLHE